MSVKNPGQLEVLTSVGDLDLYNDLSLIWDKSAAKLKGILPSNLPVPDQDGVFYASRYGATGDGVTDDTSAIGALRAAAYAYASSGMLASVIFDPGIYKVTDSSLFEIFDNLSIVGYGATIYFPSGGTVRDTSATESIVYDNGLFYSTSSDVDDFSAYGLSFNIDDSRVAPFQIGDSGTLNGSITGSNIVVEDCNWDGGAPSIIIGCDEVRWYNNVGDGTTLRVFSRNNTHFRTQDGYSVDVVAFGADLTGVSDSTVAWENAMKNGGEILIPAGTYLLSDCTVPSDAGDITITPVGSVTIKWPDDAADGILFDAITNVDDQVTVDTIADEDSYPTTFDQRTTRLTGSAGDFDNYVIGDICHIMSNDTSYDGFTKGEMFEVLEIAGDTSYIITARRLFYSYTPGTYATTIRRLTPTPKLRIKPGITFDCSDDETATIASRGFGIRLRGAVRPEINVNFTSAYTSACHVEGVYMGNINLTAKNLHVDYSDNAFGYGVVLYGPCYGTEVSVNGESCGHLITANGDMTTYDTSVWYRTGVPQNILANTIVAHNCKNAPVDWHWAIKPRILHVSVRDSSEDDEANTGGSFTCMVGAVDPYFGEVITNGTRGLLSLRDCKGVATRYVFGKVHAINHTSTVWNTVDSQPLTGSVQPYIEIQSGFIEYPSGYILNNVGNSTDQGYKIVFGKGVTFGDCTGIVRYVGNRAMNVELSGTWQAGGNLGTLGVVTYDVSTSGLLKIVDLDIIKGATYPNGIIRGEAAATACTTYVGRIKVHSGAISWTTSGSSALSIQTLTRLGNQDEYVQNATSTTASTITLGATLVTLSHTSGTPTVTIPAAANYLGLRMTIVHMALGGGTATIAPSAGTIVGSASTTIASGAYATYYSSGTNWTRIG